MRIIEVDLYQVEKTLYLHKIFLKQVRQQTELKQDHELYYDLMCLVVNDFRINGLRICPTMRVAPIKDWPYYFEPGYCHIQGDRILLLREKHNVKLCISFDLEELAKYLLLVDVESMRIRDFSYILNGYAMSLRDKIRKEYPKRARLARKKDFTIDFIGTDNEKVRVRMTEILSLYMSIVTKEKLRISKPVKIIEKMYGMPARDKRMPYHRQQYIID